MNFVISICPIKLPAHQHSTCGCSSLCRGAALLVAPETKADYVQAEWSLHMCGRPNAHQQVKHMLRDMRCLTNY